MFDYDPSDGAEAHTPESLIETIGSLFPPILTAAHVVRHSTSSEIYDAKTGARLSKAVNGFHLYFEVMDGLDIQRFGEALFKHLWLAGHGYVRIGKAGQALVRGPIDAAVFSPERCDFVAGASLVEGLEQRLPATRYISGDALDTSVLSSLSPDQEIEYTTLIASQKSKLKPKMQEQKQVYVRELVERESISLEEAQERVEKIGKEMLDPLTKVRLKGGDVVTLLSLIETDQFNTYILDPIEPESGVFALLRQKSGRVSVLSFLHGRCDYYLDKVDIVQLPRLDSLNGQTYKAVLAAIADPTSWAFNEAREKLQAIGKDGSEIYIHATLALAVIRLFALTVPVWRTTEELWHDVTMALLLDRLTERQLKRRLDYIIQQIKNQAVELTALTDDTKHKHLYKPIITLAGAITRYEGVFLIKAPMASGKTQLIGKPFSEATQAAGHKFFASCHRISLTKELAVRLSCDSYLDVNAVAIRYVKGLAICINSIIKDLREFCLSCEYLFLDEISQILRHIAVGSVTDTERAEVFNVLVTMIRRARCVIAADADLNDDVVRFFELCRPEERFNIYEMHPQDSGLQAEYTLSLNDIENVAIASVVSGKPIICATDSTSKAEALAKVIECHCPNASVLMVHRGNKKDAAQKAFLDNPQAECVRYDVVIHSPVISSGISIECDHFQLGIGMFGGTCSHSDAVQMLRRCRTIKQWCIWFDHNRKAGMSDLAARLEALESLSNESDSTVSDFDRFIERSKSWEAKSKAMFATNILHYLSCNKFTLSPFITDGVGTFKHMLKKVNEERRLRILEAKIISDEEADELDRSATITEDEQFALYRWRVCHGLAIIPEALTLADIEFYAQGYGLAKAWRYSLARDLWFDDDDKRKPLSLRRHSLTVLTMYEMLFSDFPIDLKSGDVELNQQQCAAIVDRAWDKRRMLAYLGMVPARWGDKHTQKPDKRPAKAVIDIFEKIGLTLRGMRQRDGDERYYIYVIDRSEHDRINRYAMDVYFQALRSRASPLKMTVIDSSMLNRSLNQSL